MNTNGEVGRSLYFAFVVGSTLAVLAASGSGSSWDWPEVCVLAQRQAERL